MAKYTRIAIEEELVNVSRGYADNCLHDYKYDPDRGSAIELPTMVYRKYEAIRDPDDRKGDSWSKFEYDVGQAVFVFRNDLKVTGDSVLIVDRRIQSKGFGSVDSLKFLVKKVGITRLKFSENLYLGAEFILMPYVGKDDDGGASAVEAVGRHERVEKLKKVLDQLAKSTNKLINVNRVSIYKLVTEFIEMSDRIDELTQKNADLKQRVVDLKDEIKEKEDGGKKDANEDDQDFEW